MKQTAIKLLLVATFFALYFMLGCQYGRDTAHANGLDYNPMDPNIDLYYDRDSGRGDSNYE